MIETIPAVVVLAGGLATRMRPLTDSIPKAMLNVDGEPFIGHQLRQFRKQGVTNVILCVGHQASQIADYVGDGSQFELTVRYSFDGDRPLGTGGALSKALPLLGEDFFVTYGDSFLDIDLKPVIASFRAHRKLGLMTVVATSIVGGVGNADCHNGSVTQYLESPERSLPFIDYGMNALSRDVFNEIKLGTTFGLPELFRALSRSRQLAAYEVKNRFYEIGSFDGLRLTSAYLARRQGIPNS